MTNDKIKPFSDVRVRRAISLAIDRKALLAAVYQGFGKPALYNLTSAVPQPKPPAPTYTGTYSPQRAKALLAQAGYPHGLTITLATNIDTGPGPQATSLAALIQSELAKVGVTVKIETVASSADYTAGLFGGKYQAAFYASKPNVVDAAYAIKLVWDSRGLDVSHYANATLNHLVDQMFALQPGPARTRAISAAASLLNSQMPSIPLVETVVPWVIRSSIVGAAPNPLGGFYLQDLKAR